MRNRFHFSCLCCVLFFTFHAGWNRSVLHGQITSSAELVAAINGGAEGDVVNIAAGTFEIDEPLKPKVGMTIVGAGQDQTFVTASTSFIPESTLQEGDFYVLDIKDNGLTNLSQDLNRLDETGYLIDLDFDTTDVSISGIHFSAPNVMVRARDNNGAAIYEGPYPVLHGAIWGARSYRLELRNNTFSNFAWSGIRTWGLRNCRIEGNEFRGAGGRKRIVQSETGGQIFGTFTSGQDGQQSIFRNNRFSNLPGKPGNVFGIKGRQFRNSIIDHNTIQNNFAIELPFENDYGVEITKNVLAGVVSIPKGGNRFDPQSAGGVLGPEGEGFLIRENYFTRAYSIEAARRNTVIERNLFDFDISDDGGNLIVFFGNNTSTGFGGPLSFVDNLVKNPGRGILATDLVLNNIEITGNHIIADETVPYTIEGGVAPGLFGLKPVRRDFNQVLIDDDITDANVRRITVRAGDEIIRVNGMFEITITRNGQDITLMESQFASILDGDTIIDDATESGFLIPSGNLFIDAENDDWVTVYPGDATTSATVNVFENADFNTVSFRNNIIEVLGDTRPMLRNDESRQNGVFENNLLANVEDSDSIDNPGTGNPQGPSSPLRFTLGANDEFLVDGFSFGATPILGDVNGDTLVNLLDIQPFVDALSNGEFNFAADTNGDGLLNLLDIEGFVQLLSN